MFKTVGDLCKGKTLVTVRPDEPLDQAFACMIKNGFHHLPVCDVNGDLVGIISDKDLMLAAESPLEIKDIGKIVNRLSQEKVSAIMSTNVISIDESSPIVDAAKIMRVSKINCLPITKAGTKKPIGIVTSSDLLDHLIRVLEPLTEQNI
jgi:CBS domain-containing protein